ncbi:hypothetical protein LDENG_00227030, partial [Lucifuga dentata]
YTRESLAIHGKASQSSLYQNSIAYNAIDGNHASKWEKGSCSHTNNDFGSWWRLDLRKTHEVFSVKIATRDALAGSLFEAEICIGDSLDNNGHDNPKCAMITSIGPGTITEFQCNGMDGRYVNIVVPGRNEYCVSWRCMALPWTFPVFTVLIFCNNALSKKFYMVR